MPKPIAHTPAYMPARDAGQTELGDSDASGFERKSHDLESHMDELAMVDEIRKKSAEMRTKGHEALVALPVKRLYKESLYTQFKHARIAWQYSKKDKAAQEHILRIEALRNEFTLDAVQRDYAPTLAAVEAMRAFVSVGPLAICQETMLCWYWVVREIFTAAKPDWCIGGARAGDTGWVTAYSTSQCVRALCDLVRALEETSELLVYMQDLTDHIEGLDHGAIPNAWKKLDAKRLCRDMSVTFALASNVVVFDISAFVDRLNVKADDIDLAAIKQIMQDFKDLVGRRLGILQRDFIAVSDELDHSALSGTLPAESKTGHAIASEAVVTGKKIVDQALCENIDRDWFANLAAHFRAAAAGIKGSVSACRGYLSSVIDRQLAAVRPTDNRSWEPAELAYAVSAYAQALGNDYNAAESERLKVAAQLVCADLSADGTIPNRVPFHLKDDSQYSVNTEELLGAVADLVRASGLPISGRFVTNVQHFFERQRMRDDRTQALIGWAAEFDHHRDEPNVSATVDAVESLGMFNRMLDDGINRIILEHFTVRSPKPTGLRLNALFYPDYGLEGLDRMKSEALDVYCVIRREPVAFTMQEMRRHVLRAGGMRGLNSIVLHGPGGTGKTTVIEALANTCNVPLVEVTPSDIAIGGEGAIERRARAVFGALSMLSRVVILFDEFDPILKRRNDTGTDDTTIFSFLTPGMLPKLKALHDSAQERSVAFALITNLIGTLDLPAVRKGRFDEAVGIYPPDPLSRAGYIAYLCHQVSRAKGWKNAKLNEARFFQVIAQTGGRGMTALTSAGWFRPKDKRDLDDMPIGYIFERCPQPPSMPEKEATFDEAEPKGEGLFAYREYMQWGWLNAWDDAFSKAFSVSVTSSSEPQGIDAGLGWPLEDGSIERAKALAKNLQR